MAKTVAGGRYVGADGRLHDAEGRVIEEGERGGDKETGRQGERGESETGQVVGQEGARKGRVK